MTTETRDVEARAWRVPALRSIGEDAEGRATHIEGRAVPYDVWEDVGGWFQESMAPGVFDKSIKESARHLPLLLWHESRSWPIGKAVAWDSREDGLYGTWELADTPEAAKAAQLARDGFLDGLSVGFVPMPGRSVWTFGDDDDPAAVDRVRRTEARLIEVSLVPTPAYAGAGVTLVRSTEGKRAPRLDKLARWQAWRDTLSSK